MVDLHSVPDFVNKAAFVLVLVINWLGTKKNACIEWLMDALLGTWEESMKAGVREAFTSITRFLNGVSTWLYVVFVDRDWSSLRTWGRQQAWSSWWKEGRQSTFNALIATHLSTPRSTPRRRRSASGEDADAAPSSPQQTRWASLGERLKSFGSGLSDWARRKEKEPATLPETPSKKRHLPRNGSELFDLPAGFNAGETLKRRGLLEDARLQCDVGISKLFDSIRNFIRRISFVPRRHNPDFKFPQSRRSMDRAMRNQRLTSEDLEELQNRPRHARGRRRASESDYDPEHEWTVADIVLHEGYPIEHYHVITEDGYHMDMERLPNKGSRDAVFFMHGVLDTSLGWVSNGTTGSQAFNAFDMGMDVWLGNSRNNPPRENSDEEKQGNRYWFYSVDEIGTIDVARQIDYIHDVKTSELSGQDRTVAEQRATEAAAPLPLNSFVARSKQGRIANSETDLQLLTELNSRSSKSRHASVETESAFQEAAHKHLPQENGHTERLPLRGEDPTDGHGRSALRLQVPCSPSQNGVPPLQMNGFSRDSGGSPEPRSSRHRSSSSDEDQDSDYQSVRNGSSSRPVSLDGSEPGHNSENGGVPRAPTRSRPASAALPTARHEERAGVSWDEQGIKTVHGGRGPRKITPERGVDADELQEHSAPAALELGTVRTRRQQRAAQEQQEEKELYKLRAVGHSLGGAALLIYLVMCRRLRKAHHLHRLILLTPAGFLGVRPGWGARQIVQLQPLWKWLLLPRPWPRFWKNTPGHGRGVLVPSSLLRYLTFKVVADLPQIPAVSRLLFAIISKMVNGDRSEWDQAVQMPHYNERGMPAVTVHQACHIAQWARTGRFCLYDWGRELNLKHHRQPEPVDIAANYNLIDIPVDLVAGTVDGVIPKENIEQHYRTMKEAGVRVTYREFELGHLDFTFAYKESLLVYIKQLLRRE